MYKVINEYTSKVNLLANSDIYNNLISFLKNIPDIKSATVTVNFKRYMLDIKIKDYSVNKATEIFNLINSGISYSYSTLFVRFNEGKCVRYRYITSNEKKEAIYCDIMFS